jgi:VanZ family protein
MPPGTSRKVSKPTKSTEISMQIKANASGPSEGRAFALGTSVFTLGVTVGAYWEIFQWFFVGKYTMADTVSDLLVDSGGALAAALVALALRRSGNRLT